MTVGEGEARTFFAQWFEAIQVGDGKAFATGYYEPEIAGSLDRRSGYEVPIYGRPDNLVDVELGQFSADLTQTYYFARLEVEQPNDRAIGRAVCKEFELHEDHPSGSGRGPAGHWRA